MAFNWNVGYDAFTVSTKAAIYSADLKTVLIMRYPRRSGLPGGHLEVGETPDQAINREIMEELGIEVDNLKRTDFFLRNDKPGTSVILAYVGIAHDKIELRPSHPKYEFGEWVTCDEISEIDMNEGYKQLILENWPKI